LDAPVGRLSFSFINICSLANKLDDLLQVRRDRGVAVLCLAETCHDAYFVCFRRLRSDGYRVIDRPRPRLPSESLTVSTNHGGVAIVSVPGVSLSQISLGADYASFELLCARVTSGSSKSIVVVIYRPGSNAVTSTFFDDLSETLSRVASYYIVPDLNVRLDRPDDVNSLRLSELLAVCGFAVCRQPTHVRGGILDDVATLRHQPPPRLL